MPDEVVIRAEGLTKRYGATLAVDHIDLAVNAGEIVGILGPNGSGKTTTILMLLGLTEPTSGNAEVAGYDPLRAPLEVKRRVGYLPDQVGFYDGLSARDNLAYTGRLAGLSRQDIDERFTAALDRVGLSDVGWARVGTFSQGMRQRLGLAEILMKRPSVAILDEPTTALDPHSTQEFLEMIRRLKSDGTAVLLSSHHLDQVQSVCDRVALDRARRRRRQGDRGPSVERPDAHPRSAGVPDCDRRRLCRDPLDPRDDRRKPVPLSAPPDLFAGAAAVVYRAARVPHSAGR